MITIQSAKSSLLAMAMAMAMLMPVLSCAAVPKTDDAKVVDTMRTMFTAATHDDLGLFHHVACPGFYAFDAGKPFMGDELMSLIKKAHASGDIYAWQVTEPNVHVDGNTAWITYINRGSVTNTSGKKNVSWLESAVLDRAGAGWCIRFLDSTRMPAK